MASAAALSTPFGRASTAADVVAGVDMTGRRVIVTGGASGIGLETARALASVGADVTIAVRDTSAGAKASAGLGRNVSVAQLDLVDLDSVRGFARRWDGPLHVLVNNAGVMACPLARTAYGWEMQLATNHLGHFALATALAPALAAGGGRIVSVSSRGHLFSGVHLDDLNFDRRPYEPWLAYGQSKTANILFAVEAQRRWSGEGITANALHPGRIITNLGRYLTDELVQAIAPRSGDAVTDPTKTIEQGAATSVLLASSPLLDGIGGRYFEDCNEAGPNVTGSRNGYAPYALDPANAEALWQASAQLIKEHS
jgi:NAD(P)-dependent dehydrogenase (short-subunit alcohol dehydrogenase family)